MLLFFRGGVGLGLAVCCLTLRGAESAASEWTYRNGVNNWTIESKPFYDLAEAGWKNRGLVFKFPGNVTSTPSESAIAERSLAVPAGTTGSLRFVCRDSYAGKTAARFAVEILVNGHSVWRADVAAANAETHYVDVTRALRGQRVSTISLKATNLAQVKDFPLTVEWQSVELICGEQKTALFPPFEPREFAEVPPDRPLPRIPPRGLDWTQGARILKPWARVEYAMVQEEGREAQALRDRFGFNVLNAQPPVAFNSRGNYGGKLEDDKFDATLAAFRRAGYKIVIYSSIMHAGHSPPWQHGELARDHPDWSQRDMDGKPRTNYGSEWLCPNSPALAYTLEYARGLVQRYQADGIQLDNNQFHVSDAGRPTCYCVHCQAAFKAYVVQRFGLRTREFFGCSENELEIPRQPGPLYNLWIEWRYRVWAQAVEKFREELGCVVIPNTQYYAKDWVRATDMQFQCGDLVYSETKYPNSETVSSKLLLGQAYAHGKPVWSHYGTFKEDDLSRTYLRSPREIAENLYPNFGYLSNPWIVFYGFDPQVEENRAAREFMFRMFGFRDKHPELFNNLRAYGSVATLFSTRSRNVGSQKLTPAHVEKLRAAGVPLRGIHDLVLAETNLDEFRTIVAENVDAMERDHVQRLVDWIGRGGTLITTSDIAIMDELGRPRPRSLFQQRAKLDRLQSARYGRGQIVVTPAEGLAAAVAHHADLLIGNTGLPPNYLIEVRPYVSQGRRLTLHIINHNVDPVTAPWTMSVERDTGLNSFSHAEFYCPESDGPVKVSVTPTGEVKLPRLQSYGVVVLF
jgi:hypothetical protein